MPDFDGNTVRELLEQTVAGILFLIMSKDFSNEATSVGLIFNAESWEATGVNFRGSSSEDSLSSNESLEVIIFFNWVTRFEELL